MCHLAQASVSRPGTRHQASGDDTNYAIYEDGLIYRAGQNLYQLQKVPAQQDQVEWIQNNAGQIVRQFELKYIIFHSLVCTSIWALICLSFLTLWFVHQFELKFIIFHKYLMSIKSGKQNQFSSKKMEKFRNLPAFFSPAQFFSPLLLPSGKSGSARFVSSPKAQVRNNSLSWSPL